MNYKTILFQLVLTLWALSNHAFAQITITRIHLENLFGAGKTQRLYVDTTTAPFALDIGLTGGPRVYGFSNRPLIFFESTASIAVSQIPQLAARYPIDGIALRFPLEGTTSYTVFRLLDNGMFTLGEVDISPPTEVYEHRNPEDPDLLFPATFNLSWSYSGTRVETTYVNGIPTNVSTSNRNTQTTIDGWGTVVLPVFGSFNCLRVKSINLSSGGKEFLYIAQEGIFVSVHTDTTEPDEGTVMASDLFVFVGENVTSVERNAGLPDEFSLSQNYPNPFNPSTTIRFSLPKSSYVILKIYNSLGQEIETLVNEKLSAGEFEVDWNGKGLASGVYMYRIQAGDFSESKRLVLLK